jgi:hypothetical protein
MLDDEEFNEAMEVYNAVAKKTDRVQSLLDFYNNLTDFGETNHLAILHHQISQYGTPCENCGKPYRTPLASFCAACGHKDS